MMDLTSLEDLALLRESVDLECKLTAGRDGRGAVPEDFWPTYSSFANIHGGIVVVDLLPTDLIAHLQSTFGAKFDALAQAERLTLAAAVSEKVVTHARVREMTSLHPVDATRLLQKLVQEKFLEAHNAGRGAVYCLAGAGLPKPEEVFGVMAEQAANDPVMTASSPNLAGSSPNLSPSSPDTTASSPDMSQRSPDMSLQSRDLTGQRNADGCLLASQLPLPIVDDLDKLSVSLRAQLELTASDPRSKRRVDPDRLTQVILSLCADRFVTLSCLAKLVDRKPDSLREQYLTKLVRDRQLSLAFPTTPTHERQAYCASQSLTK